MLMTHIELSASLFADFLHKKRSERTTGSGADRKKVKRNGYVKRWTRGAAVGSCVALVGIFVNLIVGLSVGPNAALANLIGQKNRGKINSMVHTILTFGAVLRISLMVIGMLVARVILEASDVLPDRVRMFTSYEMLMNVYVASWLFTGGSMFVIYFRHMKGLERQFMGNQG